MKPPPQIRNTSITLYPFHLRNDGDEGYQQTAKNAEDIWQKLADVGKKFDFPELKSLRDNLICYQDGKYHAAGEDANLSDQKLLKDGKVLKFLPLTQQYNLKLNGSIEARRIHDTYAADLTFYYKDDDTISVASLNEFNPQGCLLPNQIKASLGQTLLLYAEPVGLYDDDGYRALAYKCVRAFVGEGIEPDLKCTAAGKLFGSPIFEYDNPAKQCHILVWLKQHPQTLDLATSTFNYYLMNLLCARSKVLFVYNQAEESYRLAQQIAGKLEKQLPEFTKIEAEQNRDVKLANLKTLLAAIRSLVFDYAQELRHLREFTNTIEINAKNYAEAYVKIKGLSIAGDDLRFLQKFRSLCDRKYQSQIQKYLNYLIANQDLFQQTISTIRGMVEIEQVELDAEQAKSEKKRDRQLENIIFFVGTAIGGGQIFSAAYPLIKEKPIHWLPDFSLPLHPFAETIFWSLLFGLGFGLFTLSIAVLARKIFSK
ncbi:MAG: hypothetical protein HC941_27730 [Microcoleus sp. SU_5_3]|nr:hypothetical protein [Microcoleus sp. SU_5_3]